ncbi:MAG: methyltransferase [Anaerofustis stercorihominis]|nr:methyltransferase [Anaerofustis stercorihominis]
MARIKKDFSPEELRVVGQKPGRMPLDLYNTPISYRENINMTYFDKDQYWVPSFSELGSVQSTLYATKLSRPGADNDGMVDVFGAKWKWVPSAGGAITEGGSPIFTDANEWKDKITIPDVDTWDWEADLADKPADARFSNQFTFLNGFWFERLITLMDFENAAMALVDEDQQDAVIEIFEAMTDMGIKIVDNICKYAPYIDGFSIHDDWGAQRSPFFSDEIARKLFLPFMKELVGHIHSKGRYATIHSCGHIEDRLPIFVEAGLDGWQPQNANDIHKMYDLYGDKLVIEAWPEAFDPADEKAAKQAARDFVDYFCKPGKPIMLGYNAGAALSSKVFKEELYEYSRKHYLNMK